jgi:broad specificity phosphatase PhoE
MTSDGLLREQHFGEGEGKPWAKGGGFEWTHDRRKAFKGGESSEDVRVRANEA